MQPRTCPECGGELEYLLKGGMPLAQALQWHRRLSTRHDRITGTILGIPDDFFPLYRR